MTWRERYVQGSFRGVKFLTREQSGQVGRRRAVYEIPFDDKGVASIDLGRRPRRFQINAILIGDNYDTDAKALLEAIEQPEAGLLVHPFFGTFGSCMVVPGDSIDFHMSVSQGGMAEITFDAIESRAKAPPSQVAPDRRSQLATKTDALKVANKAAFEATFTLDGVQDFVRAVNLSQLDTAIESLRKINGVISSVLSIPGTAASQIDSVSLEVAQLLDTPGDLYDSIAGAIQTVFGAVARVAGRLGIDVTPDGDAASPVAGALAARSLNLAIQSSNLTASAPPAGTRNTPARERERINHGAITNALHLASLAELAAAANEIEFESKTEAETARDLLLEQFEIALAREDVTGEVFEAIEETRAAVRSRLSNLGLAEITTYQPLDTVPADVIAYQLYGNADRSDEIVHRNGVATPGAVPSHIELEVLSE